MTGKIIGAFDVGASGGKFIVGVFEKDRFSIREIHRFVNKPVTVYLMPSGRKTPVHKMYWNQLSIYEELINGLRKLPEFGIDHLDSLGIDTWGTDGECFTKDGEIIGEVHAYRDHRLDNIRDELFKIIPERELFGLTGVISQPFNEVNQLFWLAKNRPYILGMTEFFLPVPSILYYYLCGARVCEYTWASTTQLLGAHDRNWSDEVFERLGIPLSVMPPIVKPGTRIGRLHKELAEDLAMKQFDVIATAAHDTACAYVAAPLKREQNSMIISSGTWSLVGKLISKPVINDAVFKGGFTNEGGIDNIRFLRNVMGTWIVQELRRMWSKEARKEISWDEIVEMAKNGDRFFSFIDPDDSIFYNPGNMELAIKGFCKKTGQKVPDRRETILRMVYESLAIRYRITNEEIEKITGEKNELICIVGGGAKNSLLNRFTAEASALPVVAGPVADAARADCLVLSHPLSRSGSGALPWRRYRGGPLHTRYAGPPGRA